MTVHVDRVVHGPGTKSDKIRTLNAAGLSRADIARALGIRYQHVRNVLVGDEQAGRDRVDVGPEEALAASADEPVAVTREPTLPGGPAMLVVGAAGDVMLPREARERLGIRPGSVLSARIVDDELRICTHEVAIRRVQEQIRRIVPDDVSLVDELIAERRREAARDFGDDDERS